MGTCIPGEARGTQFAMKPCGVVSTAEAVPCVRVAELGRPLGVCITIALTAHALASQSVEPRAALVTPQTAILGKALVAYWEAVRVCIEKEDT